MHLAVTTPGTPGSHRPHIGAPGRSRTTLILSQNPAGPSLVPQHYVNPIFYLLKEGKENVFT